MEVEGDVLVREGQGAPRGAVTVREDGPVVGQVVVVRVGEVVVLR